MVRRIAFGAKQKCAPNEADPPRLTTWVEPYHYEYGDEEWLMVLSGTASVRTPEGTAELGPWDVTCFPPGPAGAHQVRNATGETIRILMFSTRNEPAATVYPDSDKIAIHTGNREDDVMVRRSSVVDYYDGESA